MIQELQHKGYFNMQSKIEGSHLLDILKASSLETMWKAKP